MWLLASGQDFSTFDPKFACARSAQRAQREEISEKFAYTNRNLPHCLFACIYSDFVCTSCTVRAARARHWRSEQVAPAAARRDLAHADLSAVVALDL